MTDIDISQKDFSIYIHPAILSLYIQDGFDNTEVNNSLTVY
ncbi:hypothetical protein [Brachyspira hyodysenteriae]|nr:hypothetical protein [Brachyspira hyodysenteriae]MCZ9869673.1 hypothetical protein [Brachyspira hyodysenteriae]